MFSRRLTALIALPSVIGISSIFGTHRAEAATGEFCPRLDARAIVAIVGTAPHGQPQPIALSEGEGAPFRCRYRAGDAVLDVVSFPRGISGPGIVASEHVFRTVPRLGTFFYAGGMMRIARVTTPGPLTAPDAKTPLDAQATTAFARIAAGANWMSTGAQVGGPP